MPRFYFEAMNATGMEIRDHIEAADSAAAEAMIRQRGYFVTLLRHVSGNYSPHTGCVNRAICVPFLPQIVAGIGILILGIIIGTLIGAHLR